MAVVQVKIDNTPVRVSFGDDTTEAQRQASIATTKAGLATTEADRSELNAGYTEEFLQGISYASQALGEAATTEGQFFRVPIGTVPETYTRYQRTAGGSVVAAPLASTADLASTAAGKGAELVAYAHAAGAAGRNLATKTRQDGPLTFRDYGAIGSADDSAVINDTIAAAIAANKPITVPAGETVGNNIDFLRPISVVGEGMESVLKNVAGATTYRPFTWRDFNTADGVTNGRFLIANVQFDGNGGGKTSDGVVQISKGTGDIAPQPFITNIAVRNTTTAAVVNGMNIAGAEYTLGANFFFESCTKAQGNITGNSRYTVMSNYMAVGDTTPATADVAAAFQVNNASDGIFANYFLINPCGPGFYIDNDASPGQRAADDISVIGLRVKNTGQNALAAAGTGFRAWGDAANRASRLSLGEAVLQNSGVNITANGVYARYYDYVQMANVSALGASQNAAYFRDCTRLRLTGITLADATGGALLAVQETDDLVATGLQGIGNGATTTYALNIVGECERLWIEAGAMRGWGTDALNVVDGFPKDSFVEFPIDKTITATTTLFQFPTFTGQMVVIEIDLMMSSGTNQRSAKERGTFYNNAGTIVLRGQASLAEVETTAGMSGLFSTTGTTTARFRAGPNGSESTRCKGVARVWSLG